MKRENIGPAFKFLPELKYILYAASETLVYENTHVVATGCRLRDALPEDLIAGRIIFEELGDAVPGLHLNFVNKKVNYFKEKQKYYIIKLKMYKRD